MTFRGAMSPTLKDPHSISKELLDKSQDVESIGTSKESFEMEINGYLKMTRHKILYGEEENKAQSPTSKYPSYTQFRSVSPHTLQNHSGK